MLDPLEPKLPEPHPSCYRLLDSTTEQIVELTDSGGLVSRGVVSAVAAHRTVRPAFTVRDGCLLRPVCARSLNAPCRAVLCLAVLCRAKPYRTMLCRTVLCALSLPQNNALSGAIPPLVGCPLLHVLRLEHNNFNGLVKGLGVWVSGCVGGWGGAPLVPSLHTKSGSCLSLLVRRTFWLRS